MPHPTARIGAHLSAQGGAFNIFTHANKLDINYIQFFTRNNRQWHFEGFEEHEIKAFKEASSKYNIPASHIFSHSCYLLNFAADEDSGVPENSHKGALGELKRCSQLGMSWTVVHPGSNGDIEKDEALSRIGERITRVLSASNDSAGILLENSAGRTGNLPSAMEDVGKLLHSIKKHHPTRIGVCIDTAHLWAKGYAIGTKKGFYEFWDLVEREIGIENIKLIHTNDSMKEFGSRIDRHAHIGEGTIGLEAFESLMQHPQLFHIPKVLETPFDAVTDLLPDIQKLKQYA